MLGDGFSIKMSRSTASRLPSILRKVPGFGASARAVQSFVLPSVQPTDHSIAVYDEDVGELFERVVFSGAFWPGDARLPGRFDRLRERKNELHLRNLPEGKIPDYLCTIT